MAFDRLHRPAGAWPLWLALSLPALLCLAAAGMDGADPDALTKISGQIAMVLLALALGAAGLAKLGLAQLLRYRRALGLSAFASSVVHLGLYLASMGSLKPVLAELDAPGIWTGWASLLLLLPLALTSNDAAMRGLGRRWKALQRLGWPAAGLALAHTYIVHDGQALALMLAGLLIVLQLIRFTPGRTNA